MHIRLATIWAIGAGLFMIVYPGRTPFDLIWLILPLSYIASFAIVELFRAMGDPRSNLELIGLVGLLLTLVASGVLSFVAYGSGNVLTINPSNPSLVIFLFIALAAMGLSVLLFFGIGWSWKVVIHALGILLLMIGFTLGISSSWRLNFSQDGPRLADLWWQSTPTKSLPLMVTSLNRTALAFTGYEHELQVDLQDEAPPAIIWALRDFDVRKGETAFGAAASPVILAMETGSGAALPTQYIGQSFGLIASRGWSTFLPPDLLRWLIAGEVPSELTPWVLWVRADIASFGDIDLDR
jgi:hypothetical protein